MSSAFAQMAGDGVGACQQEESTALLPLPPKATSDRVLWHVFHLSHLRQKRGSETSIHSFCSR